MRRKLLKRTELNELEKEFLAKFSGKKNYLSRKKEDVNRDIETVEMLASIRN